MMPGARFKPGGRFKFYVSEDSFPLFYPTDNENINPDG